jgi:hypothetical protein
MDQIEKTYKEVAIFPITENGRKGLELVLYTYGDDKIKVATRNFWTRKEGEKGVSKNVKIPRMLVIKTIITLLKVLREYFKDECNEELLKEEFLKEVKKEEN